MFRSLRARLILIWMIVVAASVIAGILMVGLFRQSTQAQIGRAEAVIERSCDSIARNYRFYTRNWAGPAPKLDSATLKHDLINVVQVALRDQPGVEGGIWQSDAGSLGYAYPTYDGTGPKTDLPDAELPRIRSINVTAATDDDGKAQRFDGRSQTLLLHACPLGGVIDGLTAWTMTRVSSAGQGVSQLRLGLSVLGACVLAAAGLLSWLLVSWTQHVGRIETELSRHDADELPALPPTGEPELDRIVTALNRTGARLSDARRASADMARKMATAERLTAIGRMTASFAHEIRNPIAAMRLKAENALAGDDARRQSALVTIIEQVGRLDRLVAQLLTASHRKEPVLAGVPIQEFFDAIITSFRERASSRGVTMVANTTVHTGNFDRAMIETALDNLIDNALKHMPNGGAICLKAQSVKPQSTIDRLCFMVCDNGPGIMPELRATLFEPFITGRADGTGLGLSIVREVAESHGGQARLVPTECGACFEIELPVGKAL